MRIDQLVPAFHRGDAIGDEAAFLREFFRSRGHSSEVYRLTCDRELEAESEDVAAFPAPGPSDIVILHFALPSPLSQVFSRLRCRKVLVSHNVTAAEFFHGYSDEMVRLAQLGREELRALAPVADVGLADSPFNARELAAFGCRQTHVFPLFIDLARYEKPYDRFTHSLFRDERTNILFVGRIAPNKKIEDLIRVVFYYKKYISPLVRLIIVGKTSALPRYYCSLVKLADDFYLRPEELVFTGHVSDEEMFSFYRAADVFVSLSEHEGFCLPLIESMIFELPVVAFNATAVPDTLGGAGILVNAKNPARLAELVDIVARDRAVRDKIVSGQRSRLKRFMAEGREPFLLELIERWSRESPGKAKA
ncbi:MAG: glycosyltransferase family 4 protein [Candidatus Aminicenantes bacterium]|nr:glycosyltransferase family 4 protein [Candidatus Aminicenantes bacterium]